MALVPRRAGDRGALRAGVHPSLLPGGRRVSDQAERAEIEGSWGEPFPRNADARRRQILEACANREIDVLFLIGVDPLRDFPDADLVRRALANARHVVVQSLELGSLEPFADAFLPAAAWIEREGHATDWEGRSQPIHPVRGPAGVSRPDWEIFAGLAEAVGRALGFEDLEDAPGGGRAPARAALGDLALDRVDRDRTRPSGWASSPCSRTRCSWTRGGCPRARTELKAALGQDPFVELHPEDADKRGLVDGGRATVTTDAGEAVLDVRVTEHVAQGAAFVPFNQPGLAANELLSGSFTTAVRIEPAGAAPRPARGRGRRGGRLMDWLDWLLLVARVVVVFFALLILVMLLIWMERKVIADMQTRVGPMRAGPRGVLITLADGIKLFFKEGITPTLVGPAGLPARAGDRDAARVPRVRGDPVRDGVVLFGREVPFQIADLSIGILWILAMSSLMVYAIVLAGWSSGSNYPLLGGVRSSAQMISYEIGMALAIVAVVMYSDTLRMSEIVASQDRIWNVIPQFPAFVIYLVCGLAETNRPPFDLPEAETELVAGYHTEYSGIKFAMFYLGEYLQHRHRGGRRDDAVARRVARAGARRRAVALAAPVVPAQGPRDRLRLHLGPRDAPAVPVRPADGVRVEGPDPDRSRVGDAHRRDRGAARGVRTGRGRHGVRDRRRAWSSRSC